MKKATLFIPLIVFGVLCIFLFLGLGKNPQALPSQALGKPLPEFSLPTLESNLEESVSHADLTGTPFLLNVWATWCTTCLIEHPYLYELSKQGIKIVGINYKDKSRAAIKWLEKYNNPYTLSVYDENGRLGFDLGVTGAPETYLVNAEGRILYRHIGAVNENAWKAHFSVEFEKSKKIDNNEG